MLAVAVALALALVLGLTAAGPALAADQIPLPSPVDRANLPANPTELLGPDRPNEIINKAPGPIQDTEHVHVGIDPTGKPVSVAVDQQLVLSGVGDFDLKIPRPALDVSGPPEAANLPGLRRGSVVWAGFSGGRKTLTAHVVLNPDLEAFKLPLAVTISPDQVRIENRTAIPVPVVDGDADPAVLRRTAAAVQSSLAAGGSPTAGVNGVPASLPTSTAPAPAPAPANVDVAAPLHLVGTVTPPGQPAVSFDAIVPGPQAPDGVLQLPVSGAVRFTATPSPPDPASVVVGQDRAALRSLEVALWQVLRVDDLSAYLGNPFPGSSQTTYTYEPAVARPAAAVARAAQRAKPFAIGLALVAALAVLVLGGLLWAKN